MFNLEKITPDGNFLHRHRLWCLWQIWGMRSVGFTLHILEINIAGCTLSQGKHEICWEHRNQSQIIQKICLIGRPFNFMQIWGAWNFECLKMKTYLVFKHLWVGHCWPDLTWKCQFWMLYPDFESNCVSPEFNASLEPAPKFHSNQMRTSIVTWL